MSLLFFTALMTIILIINFFISCFDNSMKSASLDLHLVLSPVYLSIYGLYSWLKFGSWDTITVQDVLIFIGEHGVKMDYFFGMLTWEGINEASLFYLDSSIGWTLVICVCIINIFDVITDDNLSKK